MSLLEVDGAACEFRLGGGRVLTAVSGVSFAIESGETLALVGESGCGKSTLARAILRLEPLARGSIRFDGEEVSRLSGRGLHRFRSRVQAVFQDPYSSLNPRLRVATIVAEPLRAHGQPRREEGARVASALERVGLPASAARLFPHEFSGGQRQRIAIARALVLEPELIVLDEPISALDVSIRAQILNLLQDIQDDLGLSYLFIAHDLALVEQVSDRLAVMYLGEIVEIGTSGEIFAAPSHPYTRALLAAVPSPDPAKPRPAGLVSGETASPLDPPAGCRFHPRCPDATGECRTTPPTLTQLTPRTAAACHHPVRAGLG